MKKNIKCAFVTISTICCLCFIALTLFACDLYRKTEDAYYGYSPENAGEYNVINKAEPVNGDVTNPVVVICFADESADSTRSKVNSELRSFFVGEDNSLKDYYDKVSYGNIGIDTIFPDAEGEVFVYRSDKPRSYYKAITDASGTKRYANESALLNAAIKAADEYFDYSGKSLDVNGDGYVDSVSFLVSGKDSDGSGWGGLLWPHSWELAEISRLSSTTAEKLNNITVNKFTLNFLETVDVGFLCHEAGHVFGMPDLYHYDYDKNYIQVGQWDIMHLNNEIPQYPSVYIRDKYLRSIGDNQIKDLTSDGAYSLKPVTTATAEDVVACRIKISDSESIYMEYRNNGVSTYDSMLSGSGLIVYRVNNTVTGNTKGRYRNSRYPDELYVYRPTVATGGDLRSKELKNLSYAYLSADNAYFNNVGSQTSTKSYDENAIYLTDGKNTGIILKITAQSDEAITFEVGLNGYGSEKVTDLFVEGNTEINYGEPLDITVKIKTSGYDGYAVADPSRYTVQYDPEKIGVQTATVVYTDESGGRIKYNFNVTIKDMPTVDGFNLATGPTKTVYAVGEKIDLSGLSVAVEYKKAGAVEIKYSQSEDYRWETEGADTTRSGVYEMKITYLPFGRYVTVTIKVVSELVSLSASDKDSLTVVGKNENLTINVVGVYEDGTTKKLTPDEYETT
ncbi:MAG: M6 family metalloprotease domain-containing protein, partial [Christensenellales bacterium]